MFYSKCFVENNNTLFVELMNISFSHLQDQKSKPFSNFMIIFGLDKIFNEKRVKNFFETHAIEC